MGSAPNSRQHSRLKTFKAAAALIPDSGVPQFVSGRPLIIPSACI